MEWNRLARQLLRAELVRRDVNYARLAQLLVEMGVAETERSIANKLARGTFQFVFFLQCMKAIGAGKTLLDLDADAKEPSPKGSSKTQSQPRELHEGDNWLDPFDSLAGKRRKR